MFIHQFAQKYIALGVLLSGGFYPAFSDVQMKVFGNNMVLQRGMPVPVWGTAANGEEVTVTIAGQTKKTTTGSNGKWSLKLDSLPTGGPYEMKVQGSNTLVFSGVLVGEVWLCSGQSNMAWTMNQLGPNSDSAKSGNFPEIRLFDIRQGGTWAKCEPNRLGTFSATAYYFGRELHRKLNVPIGLMTAAVGGTAVERWMDPQSIQDDPDNLKLDSNSGDLYRAHIQPLVPYGIRGAIWYQGESNADKDKGNPSQYAHRFPNMIKGWRKVWSQGDFPFHYVQLANHKAVQTQPGEDGFWPQIREKQRLTLAVKNTGMAVTIDIGMANDIHPTNKYDVGKRLSLWALARDYGVKNLVYSGPMFESMRVEGNKAYVKFRHVGGGLSVKGGGALKGFVVAGSDKQFKWADAIIVGDEVVVSSSQVANPVVVRYGWANNPTVNLYNAEGLPASPFTTEGPQLPVVGISIPAHPVKWQTFLPINTLGGRDAMGRQGFMRTLVFQE